MAIRTNDDPANAPGRQSKAAWLLLSILSALPLLSAVACRKPASIATPPAAPDPRIQEYLAKGDEYFQHQDLYGWRMAEDFYARAHALRRDNEIKDKLLLTRVLRICREIDEDIVIVALEKVLASDCSSPGNARQQSLCQLALQYAAPHTPGTGEQKTGAVPKPDWQDSSLDSDDLNAYLQILHAKAFGFESEKNLRETAAEKFKSSPLFLYLNLRKVSAGQVGDLEKLRPDFAELFDFTGERRMQEKRYRESRVYFNKALELVADYTRAINGLGNIYLYVLEEYAEALRRYEAALKFDPINAGALYGMGVVLHSIGRFAESNQVIDRMIATDISRGGRLDDYNVRFYRGMGRYYQAYNCYLLSEPQESRKFIDLAKKELPNSEQINYLSGVFYFNANQMEPARADFEQVLASGNSNCEAHNYLGLIYLQTDGNKAASFFLRMCSCVESAIRYSKREIESLPSMDLEPAERDSLKIKLENKLSRLRSSSADMIKNAITMIDLTDIRGKDFHRKLMEEFLQRITDRNELKKNP